MYSKNVNVEMPHELLKEMNLEGIMVNSNDKRKGIVVLSKDVHQFSRNNTVRIYRMHHDNLSNQYFVVNELEAFTFGNYKQAKQFIQYLPKMTAIEMLLLQNPLSQQ